MLLLLGSHPLQAAPRTEQSAVSPVQGAAEQPIELVEPAESLLPSENSGKSDANQAGGETGDAEEARDNGEAARSRLLADDVKRKQLRAKAWAGLVALAGILIAGGMLILLTLVGARRLKRLNRRPLPPQHRIPEYWFINKSPPVLPPGAQKSSANQELSNGSSPGNQENASPPVMEDDRPTPPDHGA
ncbi:hypothetical protein [Planctopirus ephydatiae]|uniref:hypothetical protein n=1 Tax=Planctopirus ephydatiae TaxID=2528019 RepID=UPI0016437920|nr:hypothetical protein [Planctopirus ephydatiae]